MYKLTLSPRTVVQTLGYEFLVVLEEGLEMFGVILFIYSLMAYMAKQDILVELAIRGYCPTAAPAAIVRGKCAA